MPEKKVPVNVLLPEHVNSCIKELAQKTGRTRSAYIRQILRRYVRYIETRDDPDAPPINWDIETPYPKLPHNGGEIPKRG